MEASVNLQEYDPICVSDWRPNYTTDVNNKDIVMWRVCPLKTFPSSYGDLYSVIFECKDIPDVKIHLDVNIAQETIYYLELKKTPLSSADATLRVMINADVILVGKLGGWTDCRAFYDIYNPYANLCRTIVFELTWHGFETKCDMTLSSNLFHYMKDYFATPDWSDATLIVNKEEIPIYRVILAAQSPVFKAIFQNTELISINNRINVEGIEVDIMKIEIKFLYMGTIDSKLDIDTIFSIPSVAETDQINHLKDLCKLLCEKSLNIENCLKALEHASLYTIPKVLEMITAVMIKNRRKILESQEFKNLYDRNPKILLDFLTSSE